MAVSMACKDVLASLAEFIAGDLDREREAAVRAHLPECASCRGEEAEMRSVLELLAGDLRADGLGGVMDPGEEYWARLPGRIRTARAARDLAAKPTRRRWLPRLALAASLVVMIAMLLPKVRTGANGEPVFTDEDLYAALESNPQDPLANATDLSADDMQQLEDGLLAANGAKKPATPAPSATAKKVAASPAMTPSSARAASPSPLLDESAAGGQGYDLDDLTPAQMDELLQQLDAMKT